MNAMYQRITGEEAANMTDGVILDVRTREEYCEGHIPHAVHLPYDEIEGKAESILPEKAQTILVYCRSGKRSEMAAKALLAKGYEKVYDFGGILTDWKGKVVQ